MTALPLYPSAGRIPTEYRYCTAINSLRFTTRTSCDVDEHANHLSQWQQSYDQLSKGRFQGLVRELWVDGPRIQIFHEHTGQQTSQQCLPWAGAAWFGIPDLVQPEPLYFCGQMQHPAQRHTVLMARRDTEFTLRTPQNFGIYGVVVDEVWLRSQLDRLGKPASFTLPHTHLRAAPVTPALHTALCETMASLLRLAAAGEALHGGGQLALHALLDHLLALLCSAASHAEDMVQASLRQRRLSTVMAARDLVCQPLNHVLTVDDICAQLHLTRRTLHNHFHNVVGESPTDFLKAVRLNACRRSLRDSRTDKTIQDIASQWGFFHMGHFSHDYKVLFGELPSHTRQEPRSTQHHDRVIA